MASSPSAPAPLDFFAIARDVLARASLVHPFDPLALLPKGLDRAAEEKVLTLVARHATEFQWPAGAKDGGKTMWRIEPESRRHELARMVADGTLASALKRAVPRRRDAFARHLQSALTSAIPDLNQIPADERETATAAFTFAAEALGADRGAAARNAAAALRAILSRQAEEERSKAILGGELIGRTEERDAIEHYIETGEVIDPFRLSPPADPAVVVRPYLVTGAPGSGKSALVADLVRRRRGTDFQGPPIVLLDFDRPAIAIGGALEWTADVTRQLGLGRPALGRRLTALRAEVRRREALLDPSGQSASAALAATAEMKNGIATALAAEQMTGNTLLVVLDTFEEVLVRSPTNGSATEVEESLFGRILTWVDSLSTLEAQPSCTVFKAVRVVVAGRTSPALDAVQLARWFIAHRLLGELDTEAAVTFLRSRDVRHRFGPQRARRAVEAVGGHPLSLILLERFSRDATSEEIEETLRDKDIARILGAEAATQALYTRFLGRLHYDPKVKDGVSGAMLQAVAFPGLVLRQVTADLLRGVVVPAAGLEPIEPPVADALLKRLASQVWLVEPVAGAATPTIRHKGDVRRLMLPMMVGDGNGRPDQQIMRQQVEAVHRNAVEWFDRIATQDPAARIEAGYHRAFLQDLAPLIADADLRAQVAAAAGEDVLVMPLPARALLRYQSVGRVRLSEQEVAALPEELRETAEVDRMESARKQGRVKKSSRPKAEIPTLNIDEILPSTGLESVPRAPPSTAGTPWSEGGLFGPRSDAFLAKARAPPRTPRGFLEAIDDQGLAVRIRSAFTLADFEEAAAFGWAALADLRDLPDLSDPLPVNDDPVEHWIWRTALAQLGIPNPLPSGPALADVLARVADRTNPERARPDAAGLVLAAAVTIAAGARLPEHIYESSERLASIVSKVTVRVGNRAGLRILALHPLWRGDGGFELTHRVQIPSQLLRVYWPSLPSGIVVPGPEPTGGWFGFFRDSDKPGELAKYAAAARQGTLPVSEADAIALLRGSWSMEALTLSRTAPERATVGEILTGTKPELHDVVVDALTGLDRQDSATIDAAIEAVAALAAVWPNNIAPRSVPARDRDRRDGLVAHAVVQADRCGLLVDLMQQAAKTHSDEKPRIDKVANLVLRYEQVLLAAYAAEVAPYRAA
jgi:hypothetical protein